MHSPVYQTNPGTGSSPEANQQLLKIHPNSSSAPDRSVGTKFQCRSGKMLQLNHPSWHGSAGFNRDAPMSTPLRVGVGNWNWIGPWNLQQNLPVTCNMGAGNKISHSALQEIPQTFLTHLIRARCIVRSATRDHRKFSHDLAPAHILRLLQHL